MVVDEPSITDPVVTASRLLYHCQGRAAPGTCRLGAEDDRRPVAVAVWFHRQRTLVQGGPLAAHSAAAATTQSGCIQLRGSGAWPVRIPRLSSSERKMSFPKHPDS